jgi:hypothetical protein
MLRNVIRLHTLILVAASLFLLVAPATVLQTFGVTDTSFPVLALARVIAGLIAVLAAAVAPVPNLPTPARGKALIGLAAAYAFLSILILAQQIAIWSSLAGTLLSAGCILLAAAFAWLGKREDGSWRLATSTR